MWSWEPQQTAIYGGLACPLHISGNFTLHHVERAGSRHDLVENVHVVHFAVGNADKRGNVAVQVQHRTHLDGSFVLTELGPGEQGEAEVDGRGVQGVEAVVQVDSQRIAGT